MSIFSDLGDGFQSIVDTLSGRRAREATTEGSNLRINELSQARDQNQANAQPFLDLGTDAAGELNNFLDPNNQYDFLQSNPVFHAALDRMDNQTMGNASINGRVGAGDTQTDLANNLILAATPLINQRFNQLSTTTGIGQGTAVNQAANNVSIADSIGSTLAAREIGEADALDTANRNNIEMFTQAMKSIYGGGFF